MPEVIATKDVVVHDDAIGIDRKLFAGQPVPPNLVDTYQKATGEKPPEETEATVKAAPRRRGGE